MTIAHTEVSCWPPQVRIRTAHKYLPLRCPCYAAGPGWLSVATRDAGEIYLAESHRIARVAASTTAVHGGLTILIRTSDVQHAAPHPDSDL